MLRSMYSGVSGLRNHQTRMDVIGNNIANVNTSGFKKSRVVFQDTLYQSMRYGTTPTADRGGTNPMGVGLGMAVSSIDQIHSAAPITTTNKITDLAVNGGNGYFILKNGNEVFYTRAGAYDWDTQFNLVAANGYKVQGWMANPAVPTPNGDFTIDAKNETTGINIADFKQISAQATTNMNFTGNLDARFNIPQKPNPAAPPPNIDIDPAANAPAQFPLATDDVRITSQDVYDTLGRKQTLYFRFFKTGIDPAATSTYTNWAVDISLDPLFPEANFAAAPAPGLVDLADAASLAAPGALSITNAHQTVRAYNLQFDNNGTIFDKTNPGASQIQLTIDQDTNPNVPIQPTQEAVAQDIGCLIDFTKLTQSDNAANARSDYQNGYAAGNMVSYSIGTDGTLRGVYDNGQTKSLARVALATFNNPAGLQQVGGTLFQESINSGKANVGQPGVDGKSAITSNGLEMSNVDLSEEFTDMITTQRGFQANSRIITTSDEMLQELVNLKR